jgi:hypothetical protein
MIPSAKTTTNRGLLWAVSTAFGVFVLSLTLDRSFYDRTVADAFFSLTVAAFTLVFISVSARPKTDVWQLALLASVMAALQMLVLKVHFNTLPALATLGIGGFLIVAIRRIWSQGELSRLLNYALVPPLLLVLIGAWGSTLLGITGRLHPRTLDLSLYDFDQSLGLQPSCRLGQVILRSHWLKSSAVFLYYGLPLPIMFVYGRQLVRERNFALTAFLAFLVTGPIGVLFYNLVPACGPIYLLGARFPFDPPSVRQLIELTLQPPVVSGARNAFPSLHMCWALLVFWYSVGLSFRVRFLLFLFLIATMLAIFGLGEHYFVDVVAAFPLAVMIEAGCALQLPILDRRRVLPSLAGLTLLLGWVGLLRSGLVPAWASPISSWALIALTIAVSLFLHGRLRNAVLGASVTGTR